jgi:glycosyltransferase involved in cell wall biosynthesis
MRIGFSTSVVQRGKTGVAEYVFSLLRALAAREEHEFVLFVLEKDRALFEFARGRMELVSVPERHRAPVRNILWHQTELPRLAREHQLDVLHVPSYRRMLWRSPCPRVATIHDLAAFHVARKYDRARMFYGRVIARRLAERQEELIAVSENTARDMEKFWRIPRGRVTVIHNGINHERFSADGRCAAPLLCRHRFGLHRPFFLYVARLEHPGKNHVRLVEAFSRFKQETLSPWQLVLAGSDWHGAETIHAAIARSPLRNDVRCLGFVGEKDLPILYRAASAFVFPSLHEGFGFPALEAMASGCPVLCSTRGALGEVIGDAAMTVDPEDVGALKNQMARLAADGLLRDALRVAGRNRSQRFNWQRTAAQTLAVYARAAAKAEQRRTTQTVRCARRAETPMTGPVALSQEPDREVLVKATAER